MEGKRLCTSAEWELACRGVERRKYSYGNVYDRGKCNTPIDGSGPQGHHPPFSRSGDYEDCHSPEGYMILTVRCLSGLPIPCLISLSHLLGM